MMGLGADDDRLRPLGLDGVQGVTLTLSSAGPRVQCEAAVRFAGAPAGLMAALMPARAALPRLARALPAAAPTFRVGHFGFGALWDTIVAFAAAETRKSPAAFTDEAKAQLGVDLGADFFRLLGDEVLMTTQPVEDSERPAKATWAMAIAVQDGPAFQRGLKALGQLLSVAVHHLGSQGPDPVQGAADLGQTPFQIPLKGLAFAAPHAIEGVEGRGQRRLRGRPSGLGIDRPGL
jgi:hypothetical protein